MSIRKIKKTNSFQVRYRDHQGIQRAKTFTLKKDAEKFEREELERIRKEEEAEQLEREAEAKKLKEE